MKKLTTFLIVFLLVLASAIYMYYSHWRNEYRATVVMPYIPASAALVYEVKDVAQQWSNFQRTTIAQDLRQLPPVTALQDTICFWQKLAGDDEALSGLPLIVSVHSLGEEQVGCLFYFNTHHTATQKLLEKLVAKASKSKTYHRKEWKHHGHKVVELKEPATQQPLFYLKQGSYLVASTSALLIEDMAQSLAGQTVTPPLQLKRSTSKQGVLYINFDQIPQLLHVYLQDHAMPLTSTTWARTGLLTLQLADHHWLLSGYLTDQPATTPKLISTLSGQEAGDIEVSPYIPQSTALLQHCTFSDPGELSAALQHCKYLDSSPPLQQSPQEIVTQLDALLAGEIAHCFLATKQDTSPTQQLLLVRVSDAKELVEVLESTRTISPLSTQPSALPITTYTVAPKALHGWLPCRLFTGFTGSYLVPLDNYIILANSPEACQTWAEQYSQKQTWTHHAAQSAWLSSTLDQAHMSYFVDIQKAWPQLMQMLKPTWQHAIAPHIQALQPLVRGSVQLLCGQEEGCYVNAMLKHKSATLPPSQVLAAQPTTSTDCLTLCNAFQTEAPIAAGPFLVKSHRGAKKYTLLQDTQHRLYFLDATGKLLWKKTLEGPITTPVFEIDFYKNSKVQYLLATNQKLHLLDYYGRTVARYPQPLPTPRHPMQLNVVDYNKGKNYRFLLATSRGDIYLYDKYYRPLAGWKPKSLKQPFAGTPFHLRVQGKDYFVALQTSGDVHVINRKGDHCPGFPISLGAKVLSPLWVRRGVDAKHTQLTTLLEGGHQITLDLAGILEERRSLPQASETPLILCSEHLKGKQYVLLRPGEQVMAVLDQEGKLVFQKPHGAHQLQYYALQAKKRLYVVMDADKHLAYFYDNAGRPLRTPPLPSNRVAVAHDPKTQQLIVYNCYDQQCCQYSLDY